MKLPAASGRGLKRLKKNANGNHTESEIGLSFAFFRYEFSINLLISKTYDCGGLALKPRSLLDVHLFLFELYDPRGNKYQQLIFLILFGLAFKQPAQDAELSQTRYSFITVGDE
jgi:hypothetical protein